MRNPPTSTCSEADAVLKSVSTPSLCTTATVATLQSLLNVQDAGQPPCKTGTPISNTTSATKGAPPRKTKPTTKSNTNRKTKTDCKHAPAETVPVLADDGPTLSTQERQRLATDVFNTTIKVLTDSLKAQPTSQPRVLPAIPVLSTHSSSSSSSSRTRKLLVERSTSSSSSQGPVVPLTELPNQALPSRRASPTTSCATNQDVSSHLLLVAECSRVSLAHLRRPTAASQPTLMIMKAMLALIAKLVSHGMHNLALKELRILKVCMEQHESTSQGHTHIAQERETYATLLSVKLAAPSKDLLALLVVYQTHLLRLVATSGRPSVVESITEYLDPCRPLSPTASLEALLKQGEQEDKIVKQLESLVRTLLSLSRGPDLTTDSSITNLEKRSLPDTVLKLQVFALVTQKKWWQLAGHLPDQEKELYGPLLRFLEAYKRASRHSPHDTYQTVRSLASRLLPLDKASWTTTPFSQARYSIFRLLSSLAQSTDNLSDALDFVDVMSSMCAQSARHRTLGLMSTLRIIALRIEAHQEPLTQSVPLLRSIEAGLRSSLNCPKFFENLLSETIATRTAAVKSLAEGSTDSTPEFKNERLEFLCNVVFLCARLQLILLDQESPTKHDQADDSVHLSDSMTPKNISQCINSSLMACKLLIRCHSQVSDMIAPALLDCHALAKAINDQASDNHFVNISNIYWLCHQTSTSSNSSSATCSSVFLRRSVQLLEDRTPREKEAGFLALKLERLGAASVADSDFSLAHSVFSQAIDLCLTPELLDILTKTASSRPLRLVFKDDSDFQILLRNLSGFLQCSLQQNHGECFYDNDSFLNVVRAAILELQLHQLEQSMQSRLSAKEKVVPHLDIIFGRLLEVYTPTSYPVRRSQVCVYLLRLVKDLACDLDLAVVQKALETTLSGSSLLEDQGLYSYAPYVEACLRLSQAIHDDNPSLPEMTSVLALIKSIIEPTRTWVELEERIGDMDVLVLQLSTLESFMALTAQNKICLEILQLLIHVQELQQPKSVPASISRASQLAAVYLRMGCTGRANAVISQAEDFIRKEPVPAMDKIQIHLVRSQISVMTGDTAVAKFAASCAETLLPALDTVRGLDKFKVQQVRMEVAYTFSLVNQHSGNLYAAFVHARQCAILTQSLLGYLERKHVPKQPVRFDTPSDVDGLARDVNALSITDERGVLQGSVPDSDMIYSSAFWPIIPLLLRNLVYLYTIYSHSGRRNEAEYYVQRAEKLASSVQYPAAKMQVSSLEAQLANALGEQAGDLLPVKEAEDSLELIQMHLITGDAYVRSRSWSDANACFDMADAVASRMLHDLPKSTPHTAGEPPVKPIPGKAVRMKTKQSTVTKRLASRKPTTTSSKLKPNISAPTDQAPCEGNTSTDTIPITNLRIAALVKKAMVLMGSGQKTTAVEILDQARSMTPRSNQRIQQTIADARMLMLKSSEEAASDFTFNVLPESTLSFPALSSAARRKSHSDGPRSSLLSPPSKRSQNVGPSKGNPRKKQTTGSFTISLSEAQECVLTLQSEGAHLEAMPLCYQICELALQSTVLLSAIDTQLPMPKLHPTRAALSMELPRIESVRRDLLATKADASYAIEHKFLIEQTADTTLSASKFQQDYIDIIPESWATVSLSMSEDCSELYIVRYEARRSPFILRLPMVKHKMQDLEEDETEEFDFEAGRRELSEIIELSNYSCHNTSNMSTNAAKAKWWAERDALDRRMQELLVNIESIWLGGFKGVLSQHRRNPNLLARFRQSFALILDRHLPSRQGSKTHIKKLTLDSNILQLFIGLGDDQEGAIDIDEQLLDLLYFVIDVLQFNGERNAYDEVDFDSIATETLDALRSYHEAATSEKSQDSHLILILDKRLQAFPWESMACLEGASVSRVGSMLTLQERILCMRRQSKFDDEERFTIARSSGSYILNPGSDLTSTQSTLEPLLATVQNANAARWNAIANHAPTEDEFKEALSDSSMLLYFGHGSGNQYIRNRTIKKLDKCSEVVWLIGCSSGTVAENGDFEPTSVPMAYMAAGRAHKGGEDALAATDDGSSEGGRDGLCMAVVATLWDVTDKDIDRFSARVGDEWGLWSSSSTQKGAQATAAAPKTPGKKGRAAPKTPIKTPGRSRSRAARPPNEQSKKKSLVQAVVKGREACHLKYLNGAAAVVYGVPVYLDD